MCGWKGRGWKSKPAGQDDIRSWITRQSFEGHNHPTQGCTMTGIRCRRAGCRFVKWDVGRDLRRGRFSCTSHSRVSSGRTRTWAPMASLDPDFPCRERASVSVTVLVGGGRGSSLDRDRRPQAGDWYDTGLIKTKIGECNKCKGIMMLMFREETC